MTKLRTFKPKVEKYILLNKSKRHEPLIAMVEGHEASICEVLWGDDESALLVLDRDEVKELGEVLIELATVMPPPPPPKPKKPRKKKGTKGRVTSTAGLVIDRTGGAYEPGEDDAF